MKWLSPAEQWQHHNRQYRYDQIMHIRGKPLHGGWTTLPKAAARQAFWDCPLSALKAFAPLGGCDRDGCDDTVDVLWALVNMMLGLEDEENILEILMLRQDRASNSHAEAVGMFVTMDVEGKSSHVDA